MTAPTFWIPLLADSRIFARVFVNTLWREALESRGAWDVFYRDSFEVYRHLPPGSRLFAAMHAQVVVIQSIAALVPLSLQ